jgi:predicted nucleic acid-binding protein
MRKKVYLDTTIPRYLFDKRPEIKFLIDITKRWWQEESSKYLVVVSENTINELNRGNYPNKGKILEFALILNILPYTEEIVQISQAYIDNSLMPDDLEGDAMHLAYASYYKIDFLLTWNCNHLANANKKNHIRFLNTRLGLFIPEIITPMELFEEDKDVYR